MSITNEIIAQKRSTKKIHFLSPQTRPTKRPSSVVKELALLQLFPTRFHDGDDGDDDVDEDVDNVEEDEA